MYHCIHTTITESRLGGRQGSSCHGVFKFIAMNRSVHQPRPLVLPVDAVQPYLDLGKRIKSELKNTSEQSATP